ncbi:MAG: hypothetical protein AUI10_00260 [Actinobacteria bacterium 13_2_20CM_2_72_6]|nr:MAG: hypothetical protein AUI10_00260 [Actinobacteria bacterium 13_2_20CM_2_72_6]
MSIRHRSVSSGPVGPLVITATIGVRPGGFAVGSAPAGVTFVATQRQGSPRASRARVSCSAKPASPASLQPTATRRLLPAATATIASAMVVTSVRWRAIVARLSILNALLR